MTSHPGICAVSLPECITDRGHHDGGKQQQVSGRERAAALAQRKGDDQRGARQRSDPEQRPRPLVRDEDGDQRSGNRERSHHHAAVRSIDGRNRQRHHERKHDARAEHRDNELKPQLARWKRPAQHDQERQRGEPGNRGAQRGQHDRVDCRHGDARRRQRTSEDDHADEAQQQTQPLARQWRG